MTELDRLRFENDAQKVALAHLDTSFATIIAMLNDAASVMMKVADAMRTSHSDVAANADAVVAHWRDFIAGAQAAKAEDTLTNAPTTTARN